MRFSVIIPLYNKAEYVEKALRSVIGQLFQDFEAIVVDDGSTDSSYDVTRRFVGDSDIFTLVRKDNAGVSAARNFAASMAKGDFLCFLDADDWWAPDYLEKMSAFIDEYPDAGIYGTSYYYVKSGREQVRVNIPSGYFNYFKEYARIMQMPLWTGAVCVPASIYKEMGGFKAGLKLGEDFDLWVRIALKYKTAFLNEPLAYYNQDVAASKREIARLHDPKHHMLWNIDYLAEYEKTNPDLKNLLDSLRVYGLMPYFLSEQYHDRAAEELKKVVWSHQEAAVRKEYERPLWLLRIKDVFMSLASSAKQTILRKLK